MEISICLLEQEKYSELSLLCNRDLSKEEAVKVSVCNFRRTGVSMRKWRPPAVSPEEDWKVANQIYIQSRYRNDILSLPHALTKP